MNYEEARRAPGISADAPDAIERIREKLAAHEAEYERRKAINAYYRRARTLEGCPLVTEEESNHLLANLQPSCKGNPLPFGKKQMDTVTGSIRAFRGRIAELERRKVEPPPEGWIFDGGRVAIDVEANRVQVVVDGMPDDDMVERLKRCGFRYIPFRGAWERKYTNNALQRTKEFFKKT